MRRTEGLPATGYRNLHVFACNKHAARRSTTLIQCGAKSFVCLAA